MNKQKQKSEAIFSQIEKTMVDAFYLYNLKEAKYEFMSVNSEKITGAKPEFYYNGNDYINTFIHPEDRKRAGKAYHGIVKYQKEQKIDFRIIFEGQTKWIHEEFYPVFDDKSGEMTKVAGVISDITQQVERENELAKIQENTRLLSEIGLEIGQYLNVRSIVKNIYNRLNDMMDAEFFGIGLIDKEKQCIDFPYVLEKNTEVKTSIPLDKNVLATICVKRNETLFLDEFLKDYKKYTDKPLEGMDGEQPESVMYVPLHSKDEIIGVITIQSRQKYAYSKTDLQFLNNLSIYVARSLINANLYENMEKIVKIRTAKIVEQKKELEISAKNSAILVEMGNSLSSTLHFEKIFEKLHYNLSKLLDAEIFGVRILDIENQQIHYKYEIESGERDMSVIVPLTDKDNYTVWCVTHNESIHINDNLVDYKKYVKEIKVPAGQMPASLLFVPICHDDVVLGAISVQSFKKNAYTKRDLNVLKTLAFYTGIAMSNAKLYESLELKVEHRTKELALANKEVVDSINYAKNLQEATLIKKDEFSKLLNESFVYFKPKNIVSGDFYRVDKLTQTKDELVAFLVADCTGHGVPGSTLAILCSNIIKHSHENPTVLNPGSALTFARNSLISLFSNSETKIYDGMDIAIGVIDKKTNILDFSGAINNCYIVRNGEMLIYKGNRSHVGYSEQMNEFTTVQIQLQPKDEVYLTTDGYFDQFGGPSNKKFTRKRFIETILSLQGEDSSDKEKILEKTFKKWKGKTIQTDDICVFGFTVD